MPPQGGIFRLAHKLLVILVFALLIRNTAAGLASGLTRGLALTATAVLRALAKILRFQSLNMLHI